MILDLSNTLDRKRAQTYFDSLMEGRKRIELKKFTESKTLRHNAYLHVCFAYIAQATGFSLEEAKTVVKSRFAESHEFACYVRRGERFLTSISDYDKEQTSLLIDFIRDEIAPQCDTYIPTPDEYFENQFQVHKELNELL